MGHTVKGRRVTKNLGELGKSPSKNRELGEFFRISSSVKLKEIQLFQDTVWLPGITGR